MEIFLQVWGGSFYLLAKIFLAHAEGKTREENFRWRARGWVVYLCGVPPWVLILAENHNWIAMAIEAGGVPAMILGLVMAINRLEKAPPHHNYATKVFVWMMASFGVLYSWYDFDGLTSLSQMLEIGVTVGYLAGTYLLAKKDRRGWLFFLLMNGSMGTLMVMQEKWIFALLQVVSLYFAISGFQRSRRINENR